MKWNKEYIDPVRVRATAQKMGIGLLESSILLRRGIEEKDFKYFIEDDLKYLHNPFLFRHMKLVVERILDAVDEEEHILICGDRDADGISSTVLLYEALEHIGLNPHWSVPTGEDSYGLSKELIQDFSDKDGSLLFCVDCGISDFEEIAFAKSLGIDVVVLDHHNPRGDELPDAFAIINPKVQEDHYPFEGLAGCGVVSKLIWALCFAQTELFNQGYAFCYKDQSSETLEIFVYKNFIEVKRAIFLKDEIPSLGQLQELFEGCAIFTYGLKEQEPLIKEAFGTKVDIQLFDLSEQIIKDFPALKGYNFDALKKSSRYARYCGDQFCNGGAFINLFSSLMLTRYQEAFDFYLKSLDLTAIGTLADLMPLQDENRIIVKKGLQVLNRVERPALRELFMAQRILGRKITASDISWSVSPWINSAGRMGKANLGVELFITDDPKEREELAKTMHELNQERRNLGDSIWDEVYKEGHLSLEQYYGKIVIIFETKVPRGITGIIASRLVNSFSTPAMVISTMENGDFSGSLRSPKNWPIKDLLIEHQDFFIDFGGHDCAGGFSMDKKDISSFLQGVKRFSKGWTPKSSQEQESHVLDAQIPNNYLNKDLWDICARLEPYGQGFKPLLFMGEKLLIESCDFIGREPQNHIKFLLSTDSLKFPALYWNGVEVFDDFMKPGNRVDILFHTSVNHYMNKETPQLTIVEMRASKDE